MRAHLRLIGLLLVTAPIVAAGQAPKPPSKQATKAPSPILTREIDDCKFILLPLGTRKYQNRGVSNSEGKFAPDKEDAPAGSVFVDIKYTITCSSEQALKPYTASMVWLTTNSGVKSLLVGRQWTNGGDLRYEANTVKPLPVGEALVALRFGARPEISLDGISIPSK